MPCEHLRKPKCVYFIQHGEDGPIKIGVTTEFKDRFASIRSVNLFVRVLGIMPGGREEEQQLHKQFEKHRIEGEWFRPVDEIVQLALSLPKKPPPQPQPIPWWHRPPAILNWQKKKNGSNQPPIDKTTKQAESRIKTKRREPRIKIKTQWPVESMRPRFENGRLVYPVCQCGHASNLHITRWRKRSGQTHCRANHYCGCLSWIESVKD
jgi:T5orf172 domain